MVKLIRTQKWRWAGHEAHIKDCRWTYKSTFWFLSYLKRKRGRQLARWKDDINAFLGGKNFQWVARSRREWEWLQEAFAHFKPRINMIDKIVQFQKMNSGLWDFKCNKYNEILFYSLFYSKIFCIEMKTGVAWGSEKSAHVLFIIKSQFFFFLFVD